MAHHAKNNDKRNFYPRSPCGERPYPRRYEQNVHKFLSTLSLRRATFLRLGAGSERGISIHALLAESDFLRLGAGSERGISIHALLAESDDVVIRFFQPLQISIHALLAESDPQSRRFSFSQRRFLSTLSLRRATKTCKKLRVMKWISIHALLAESDLG